MYKRKPAVFLDRDGTINKDVPYCSCPEEFELLPGVGEAIAQLNKAGFIVVVITNQSGVYRGYFSEEMLHLIHQKMQEDLAHYKARVDSIYYCPHHPEDCCTCRKPAPGLLFRAAEKLGLDLKKSFFIGDSPTDMEAGRRAGCTTILVAPDQDLPDKVLADYTGKDLKDCIKWLCGKV